MLFLESLKLLSLHPRCLPSNKVWPASGPFAAPRLLIPKPRELQSRCPSANPARRGAPRAVARTKRAPAATGAKLTEVLGRFLSWHRSMVTNRLLRRPVTWQRSFRGPAAPRLARLQAGSAAAYCPYVLQLARVWRRPLASVSAPLEGERTPHS